MTTVRLSQIAVQRGSPAGAHFLGGSRSRPQGNRPFYLQGLTLTVPHGKTLAVLGPSGCGKSTLLRIIAGLDSPDSGRVLFNGQDVAGISPGDRRIGYLFQSYALYPHFTSKENITSYFFFRRKTPQMAELREAKFRRTSQLLDVDISYLLDRKPAGLSGGEKQRVALGRCITREPELFLLDEPFSNLDAKLRAMYRVHLKTLLQEFGITTVYVTHDQHEAALLGDSVAIMRTRSDGERNVGSLEQVGTIQELYEHPTTQFVADFLNLQGDVPAISFVPGAKVHPSVAHLTVGVRPEAIELIDDANDSLPNGSATIRATVTQVTEDPLRQFRVLSLDLGGSLLTAKLPATTKAAQGEAVRLHFGSYHLFDPLTERAVHPVEAARVALG